MAVRSKRLFKRIWRRSFFCSDQVDVSRKVALNWPSAINSSSTSMPSFLNSTTWACLVAFAARGVAAMRSLRRSESTGTGNLERRSCGLSRRGVSNGRQIDASISSCTSNTSCIEETEATAGKTVVWASTSSGAVLNHYSSIYASNNPDVSKMPVRDQAADIGALFRETRDGETAMPFPPGRMVDPQGLEHVLKYIREKYGNISIYIQENGRGQIGDDSLMDVERIDFLKLYIASTLKAIRDGTNVKGYSVWSLLDLYEMFGGYKAHFGLISVDFRDLRRQRQPRMSAYWYSDFLKNKIAIQVDNGEATATSHEQI